MDPIKITSLPPEGTSIPGNTLTAVVDMTGTPTTKKATIANIANAILSGAGGVYTSAGLANLANFAGAAGSVSNSMQPNITSVGILSNLVVEGQVNLGDVGNVIIYGGENGYVLQTDGEGTLSWTAQSGGGGGNGSPGGSNTQVQFNDASSFGGNAGFTFDKVHGALSSPLVDTATVYHLAGTTIENADLTHNATAALVIPNNGNGNVELNVLYGNVLIQTGPSNYFDWTWRFGNDGNLYIPYDTAYIDSGYDTGNTGFAATGGQPIASTQYYESGNISSQIILNRLDIPTVGTHNIKISLFEDNGNSPLSWTFDKDGNLILPDISTASINYANGDPYGGGAVPVDPTANGYFSTLPDFLEFVGGTLVRTGQTGDGVFFDGDSGDPYISYPVRTNFSIGGTTPVVVTVDVVVNDECSDFGLCVFEGTGIQPQWAWDPNPTRIAAQYDCTNPVIYTLDDSASNGYNIPAPGTYRVRFTYDPTNAPNIILETLDTANTVLDTLTMGGTLNTSNNYYIGFSADQDNTSLRTYIQNLTIAVGGGSTYTDSLQLSGGGIQSQIANVNSNVAIPTASNNVYVNRALDTAVFNTVNYGSNPSGYLSGTWTDQPTSGGTGTGMTVNYTCATTNGPLTDISINNFGSGYSNGDTITIDGGNASFTIRTVAQYTFSDNGLQLPSGGYVGFNYGYIGQDGTNQPLQISSGGNVQIQSNENGYTWEFDNTGGLTIPNGTFIGTPEGSGTTGIIAPIDTEFLIETSSLPTNPPSIIVISGADFSSVNLTYNINPNDYTIWIPNGYNPSTDPYIQYDGQWGIFVPGFGQALYVNTGTANVPLEQWNTNPPLGSVAPTGVYTYPNNYSHALGMGTNGTLTLAGDIISKAAGYPFSETITNITSGDTTVVVDLSTNVFGAPVTGQVTISGVVGTTQANDTWYYRAVETNQLQLFSDPNCTIPVDGTSWSAYVSGGNAYASALSGLAISTNYLQVVTGGFSWAFNNDGSVVPPILTVDLHNGGNQTAQTLQFGDNTQQAVITGPTPTGNDNAQRLIIQGQRGNGTGEGGDVYIWGGDSQINGGDIKIYAGDADSGSSGQGGNIHVTGGTGTNTGGEITLTGGWTTDGVGARVQATGGRGSTTGGNVTLNGGYGDQNGGPINIFGGIGGNGLGSYGNVNIGAGASTWTFDNTGNLQVPTVGNITTPLATGGAAGYNVNIVAGAADQTDYYTTAGGNVNILGGLGASNDGGGGGQGGSVNISAGVSSDPAGVSGNVTINTFTNAWIFDNNGDLTLPTGGKLGYAGMGWTGLSGGNGAPVELTTYTANGNTASQVFLNSSGSLSILAGDEANATSYTWNLDNTGNLTLPGGGSIYSNPYTPSGAPGNTITLQPAGSGTITDQRLLIYPTAGDGDHIHMVTGNLYQTELFMGSDSFYVKLANTGNVVINANDDTGNSFQYVFGADCTITFPDSGLSIDSGYNTANGGFASDGAVALTSTQHFISGNISSQIFQTRPNFPTAGDNFVQIALYEDNANAPLTWTFNKNGNLTAPGSIITSSGQGGNISGANVISANTFSASGNITGSNLIATANVLGNGYAKFSGTFDESIGANTGVVMGYAGGTPRILFGTGNTQQTFEIDNDGGNLRFYQPGSTKATLTSAGVFLTNVVVTTPTALSNLTAVAGARAFVNNANLTAVGNFGAQVGGGGSNTVPVWSDGTNWYIG